MLWITQDSLPETYKYVIQSDGPKKHSSDMRAYVLYKKSASKDNIYPENIINKH